MKNSHNENLIQILKLHIYNEFHMSKSHLKGIRGIPPGGTSSP